MPRKSKKSQAQDELIALGNAAKKARRAIAAAKRKRQKTSDPIQRGKEIHAAAGFPPNPPIPPHPSQFPPETMVYAGVFASLRQAFDRAEKARLEIVAKGGRRSAADSNVVAYITLLQHSLAAAAQQALELRNDNETLAKAADASAKPSIAKAVVIAANGDTRRVTQLAGDLSTDISEWSDGSVDYEFADGSELKTAVAIKLATNRPASPKDDREEAMTGNEAALS